MRAYRNLPIKLKLGLLVLAAAGTTCILSFGGFIAYEVHSLTERNTADLTSVADVMAWGLAAPLSFKDSASAEANLAALQGTLAGLKDAQSLRSLSASVADSSVATATAASSGVAGSYAVEVTQLAQAHKVASSGFANTTDTVGTGTLTFAFGTFDGAAFALNGTTPTRTVSIGSGQQTLSGIRDAVNTANIGVTATIVNDGSVAGNRLVFTSNTSGAANSLKVTVADSDTNDVDASGLSQLAYDPAAAVGNGRNLTQKVVAQNALLSIDGIAVSKASNIVSDAIQGVTLNLLKTNISYPDIIIFIYC